MSRTNRFRPLTAHPSVSVKVWNHGDELGLEYGGLPQDLLDVGIATDDMLLPGTRGVSRVDAEGRRFRRTRLADGRMQISFDRARAVAFLLPGVLQWLDDEGQIEASCEPWGSVDVAPLLERFRRPQTKA